jgi:hypothetical protein
MSPAVIGPENDCAGEGQQQLYTTDSSSRRRGRPTSTNQQLSDSNINLVLGPRWVLDRKMDGPKQLYFGCVPQGAWRQDEMICGKPSVVKLLWLLSEEWVEQLVSRVGWWVSEWVNGLLRFSRCELLLLEAGNWGRGQFENPEERESLLLEAVTRQRLVKSKQAEKT